MTDLNAILEPGMFVRHPAMPEWGLGQVQSNINHRITVMFASDWAEKHPLTLFDLRQEVKTLAPIGINLRIQLRPA